MAGYRERSLTSRYAAGVSTDPFIYALDFEGVPSAFVSARDGIDALLRDRGLRKTSVVDTANSLARGAFASAQLEGSTTSWEQFENGSGDEISGAAMTMASQIIALVPTWRTAPIQVLARLHALSASYTDSPGTPVNQAGTNRLHELSGSLLKKTSAPGLIIAALVHAEVLSAQAFQSHNGMVARAAERIVLIASGVDPVSITVPEVGHAADATGYLNAMAAYQSGDVHTWLLYAADAFVRGAEAAPLNEK